MFKLQFEDVEGVRKWEGKEKGESVIWQSIIWNLQIIILREGVMDQLSTKFG